MMHSPMIKLFVKLCYWIVTIAALNLGLLPVLGYNVLEVTLQKVGLEMAFVPFHYVVGVAALVSLWMLVMGCCKCHDEKCHCE